MFHACAVRFDVTRNLENFWILGGRPESSAACHSSRAAGDVTSHSHTDAPYSRNATLGKGAERACTVRTHTQDRNVTWRTYSPHAPAAPDATPRPPYAYGPGFSLAGRESQRGRLRWAGLLHPSRASSATDRSRTLFKFPGTSRPVEVRCGGSRYSRRPVGVHDWQGNPELSTAPGHANSRWTIHKTLHCTGFHSLPTLARRSLCSV